MQIVVPSPPFSQSYTLQIVPSGYVSDSGTVTFEGAGNFSYSHTSSEDGATTTSSGSGTYSLASDGTLTIENLQGYVLSGGSMFVLAATSGSPQILVGDAALTGVSRRATRPPRAGAVAAGCRRAQPGSRR